MKKLMRSSIYRPSITHEVLLSEFNGRKLKFTYRAYNAGEECSVKLFDGNQWNVMFIMEDCGESPNSSMYISDDAAKLKRCNLLFTKLEKLCKLVL